MASSNTHFRVEGALQTALRFERFPDALRDALRDEIEQIAREAFGQVAAIVPRRSGELASRERLRAFETPDSVGAVVDFGGGDDTPGHDAKAGALEYGSRGKPVTVRAHPADLTVVFGRRLNEPHERMVRAFNRTPNLRAQPFVRPVSAAMQSDIFARLERIVGKAADEAND